MSQTNMTCEQCKGTWGEPKRIYIHVERRDGRGDRLGLGPCKDSCHDKDKWDWFVEKEAEILRLAKLIAPLTARVENLKSQLSDHCCGSGASGCQNPLRKCSTCRIDNLEKRIKKLTAPQAFCYKCGWVGLSAGESGTRHSGCDYLAAQVRATLAQEEQPDG